MMMKKHGRRAFRKAHFGALSNQTRIDILLTLSEGEKNVTQLVKKLGLGQPLVSHNLQKLSSNGFIRVRKEGNFRFYALNQEFAGPFLEVIGSNRKAAKGVGGGVSDRDVLLGPILGQTPISLFVLEKKGVFAYAGSTLGLYGRLPKDCHPIFKSKLKSLFKNGKSQVFRARGLRGERTGWYECGVWPLKIGGKVVAATIVASPTPKS